MKRIEVIQFLKRIKVQTGSLACLGCGHEHNCSIHGCAIIRAAIEALEEKSPPIGRCGECLKKSLCSIYRDTKDDAGFCNCFVLEEREENAVDRR